MLRKINENEFEKYIDFAYDLALDLSKSAFPIYTDGVKDKTYFYEVAKRGIERVHHEILLFEKDGVIEGWIHCNYYEDDASISGLECYYFEESDSGKKICRENIREDRR